MLSQFSSNAILSKARAMYGKRLTAADYQALLTCQSVGEVAAYLKQRTVYAQVLSGVNELTIHRGQLESLLKKKLFFDFASLGRYELSVGEHFSDYIIARSEIEQIVHSLMLLVGNRSEEYIFSMPLFLKQHTHIRLSQLAGLKSYDDLLAAVEGTRYYQLLKPLKPAPGERPNLSIIENSLYAKLYEGVFKIIARYTRGQARKDLEELFHAFIDLNNYTRVLRLKHYFHAQPDAIRSMLLPMGRMRPSQLDAMLTAQTPEGVTKAFAETPRGRRLLREEIPREGGEKGLHDPDMLPSLEKFRQCRHHIRYSVHPPVVMLSYIFLTETEIDNLISIIEGIRYQVPADGIRNLLIYSD